MASGKYEKQFAILEYIKKTIIAKGYPPTIREICDGVGLKSSASVFSYLISLEKTVI